ncbi:hypothetical protein KCX83_16880, partial [Brucella oryzae]|uniref:hypothetical protein n=1 Tax=Brucella oryzae TaxID=335286 RepID=UPI001B81214B
PRGQRSTDALDALATISDWPRRTAGKGVRMNKRTFDRIKEGLDELRENIPALVEDTLRRYPKTMDALKKTEEAERKEAEK